MKQKLVTLFFFLTLFFTASSIAALPSTLVFTGSFQLSNSILNGKGYTTTVTFYDSSLTTALWRKEFKPGTNPLTFTNGAVEIELSGFNPQLFAHHDIAISIDIDGEEVVIPFSSVPYAIVSNTTDLALDVDWNTASLPSLGSLQGTLNSTQIPNALFTTDMIESIDSSKISGNLTLDDAFIVGDDVFVVNQNTVGIHTDSSEYPLEVNGTLFANSVIFSDHTIMTSVPPIQLYSTPSSANTRLVSDLDGDGQGHFQFFIGNDELLTLTEEGYLGVGTNDPSVPLHVNGIASANYLKGNGAGITNIDAAFIADNAVTDSKIKEGTLTNEDFSSDIQIDFSKLDITTEDLVSLGFVSGNTVYSDAVFKDVCFCYDNIFRGKS